MPSKTLLYFILFFLFSICSSTLLAQNQSVIAEDTCAPPCWFGLTAGESTTADVEYLITTYSVNEFDVFGEYEAESQLLANGVYEFTFLTRETSTVFVEIQIRDSIVFSITVHPTIPERFADITQPDEFISLNETLHRLGEPDRIYFNQDNLLYGYHSFPYTSFIYLESRLRIEFNTPLETCNTHSFGDDMLIDSITYFSPEAANRLISYIEHDELQPALTALHLGERLIASDLWQQLINSEIDQPCWQLQLPFDNPVTAPIIFDEPDTPRSLFDEDTCAPPCWMGLTVGESSADDVTNLIQEPSAFFRGWVAYDKNVFDEATRLMIPGGYSSRWISHERDDIAPFWSEASFSIRGGDGVVNEILVSPNRTILLHEVLRRLGSPDDVLIYWHEVSGTSLSLFYLDLGLNISFSSVRSCVLERMSNNFWVDYILYSSSISEPETLPGFETLVPIEIWQQWLGGEITGSCGNAWHRLANSTE